MLSACAHRALTFRLRHPILWQVLLWSVPALVFGLALRATLFSYSPYAYWGSDSRSYFSFTSGILNEFYFSLNEKRRYLYPILLLPVSMLPGAALKWVAIFQAVLGLSSILPIAYAVRRTFTGWKLWIIPVTLIHVGWPAFLWYEHEMLAECLFYYSVSWSIGGWIAWVNSREGARKSRLWWWFFVPLAIMLLTKPSGRFFLPGLLLALMAVKAWRYLGWRESVAGVALVGVTATMGDDDQGSWLLYTASFPLTQLDSPRHADYKREVADLVRTSRADLIGYADENSDIFTFLRDPAKQDERPLWKALGKDQKKRSSVYMDLAKEGILAEPVAFLTLSLYRVLASANPEEFELERFSANYNWERLSEALQRKRNSPEMLHLAFGYPRKAPIPDEQWFRARINPRPDSPNAAKLMAYSHGIQRGGRLFQYTDPANPASPTTLHPTLFGWVMIGSSLAVLMAYFRQLGVWVLIAGSYLVGVFLVGVQHPRYFAAVWPIAIVTMPALLDLLVGLGKRNPTC